jgi:hypothetical protein
MAVSRAVDAARRSRGVESLEVRRHLDASYWPLAGGSLTQDWEGPNLITTANSWSGVRSIEGYAVRRGTGTTSSADTAGRPWFANRLDELVTNPGNALTASGPGSTYPFQYLNARVTESTNRPAGNGITEVALTTPVAAAGSKTIAFLPGDTSMANGHLTLYINNSGMTAPVRIKYDLIDIDPSTNVTAEYFGLHYRVGNSGPWKFADGGTTDNPSAPGAVANAGSTVSGEVGKVTNIDVTLPADTIGASQVQIRIYETNGSGVDQAIAIDNITVFGNTGTPGVFEFSPTSVVVDEAAGVANLTITRPATGVGSASVTWTTVDGSATSGSDYVGGSGVVSFGVGEYSKTIPIPITNDIVSEGPETFTVTLSNPTNGATIAPATGVATVTIADNDTPQPTGLLLNEVVVSPVDSGPFEYVEIRGTPGTSLNNIWVVSIEGDGNVSAGTVQAAYNLSGYSIGSNGLAILKSTTGGFANLSAATTVIPNAAFDGGAALAAGSQSYALVFSAAPVVLNADWDTNGSFAGPLNNVQAGASILDIFGFFDSNFLVSGTLDRAYGPVLFGYSASASVGLDAPDSFTRFATDTTAGQPLSTPSITSATSWYAGNLMDADVSIADSSTGIGYSQINNSGNRPLGAAITPGGVNYPDGVAANPGRILLASNAFTVQESAGTATIRVVRYGGLQGSVSVDYSVVGGTAQSADYANGTGTVTFADGVDAATITLTIVDDAEPEVAETVIVGISNPTGGAQADTGRSTVTIAASDSTSPTGLVISEVSANPPGTVVPEPFEFVELRGTPNALLLDTYLLFFEGTQGTTNAAGVLDGIVNLSGVRVGSNGLVLVRRAGGHSPVEAGTTVVENTFMGSIESDTNTVWLAYNSGGATFGLTTGTDYDSGGSGNADTLLAEMVSHPTAAAPGITRVDSIAWKTATTGLTYGPTLGPIGTATTFDAVVRLDGSNGANDVNAWFGGNQTQTLANNALEFDPATVTANFPAGYKLTPGGANVIATDTTPPTVTAKSFSYLGQSMSITLTFSEDVAASLAAADFTLVNNTTPGFVITASNLVVTPGAGNTAKITFTGLTGTAGSSVLQTGNYTLTALGAAITDAAGNKLGGGAGVNDTLNFRFVVGDTNNNGTTNFDDLLVLAANYNVINPSLTYASADFNYSGSVNFDDLLLLAANYNVSLPGVPASIVAPPAPNAAPGSDDDSDKSGLFGEDPIF